MRFSMVFLSVWLVLIILTPTLFSEVSELELESLVAGVKYNDSLLKTGKGHFIIRQVMSEEAERLFLPPGQHLRENDIELTVVFDGVKLRCETADEIEIFDGEKRVEFYQSEKYALRSRGIHVGIRAEPIMDQRYDPRYWGLYASGKPLGEYLEEKAIKVVGHERINGILCHVVEAKRRRGVGTIKFWIAPEQGFRALKSQHETSIQDHPLVVTKETVYQELKDGLWFPKSARHTSFLLDKKTGEQNLAVKDLLTVEEIEINGDVSDSFEFNIPPDTIVWDYRSGSKRTAAEAGISTNKQ